MWKALFIENTSRCNLLCPGCKRPRDKTADMPWTVYRAALSKLPNEETRAISFFWRGEPTLDRRLPLMAQMAKDIGLYTYTSTNTSTPLLHDEDYVSALLGTFDKICFCVDGYDQESINKYRVGSKWETIIKNLETISDVKAECFKEMRTLMFKFNDGHEDEFIDMARRYGMDTLFFGLPIINGNRTLTDDEAEQWLSSYKKFRRYRTHLGDWIHRGRQICNFIPIVSVNGDIASCCYDWKIRHPLGNVVRDNIANINAKYINLRRFAKKLELSMCRTDCFIPTFPVNIKARLTD